MSRNEALAISNYTLSKGDKPQKSASVGAALKRLAPLLADDKKLVALAFAAMVVSSLCSLAGPAIIARTIDTYIQNRDFNGVVRYTTFLAAVYMCGLFA